MSATFIRASPYQGDAMELPVGDVNTAVTFYRNVMGFTVVERTDSPIKAVVLARDEVRIGLAENGGDPEQNGCFFEVDNAETAFAELKANGLGREVAGFRTDRHGEVAYKVFFAIAPDGLCFCFGERQN